MPQVEFVRVTSELSGYGFGKGVKYTFSGAEEIIKQRIADGWTFCGYIPLVTRGTGDIETMSLIFRKA